MNRRSLLLAAAGAWAASLPGRGHAGQPRGVHFAPEVFTSDVRLKLLGTGLYYYKIFIKVAAAGLYLPEETQSDDVLADVAKRLEMQYFWGVKASELVRGSNAMLARNLSEEQRHSVQPLIDQMHGLYTNVVAGDRCAMQYVPGAGTSLLVNGKRLGIVPGAEFAAAYFSIWFGEKPLDATLKRKLLGEG